MRRYHHIGIPTSQPRPGERHIEHLKIFIVGHENSEYGVEWMRFEADATIPELVRQVPHVAFEVSDLASELVGREILIAPNSPSDGVRVAFIVENGAPIECLSSPTLTIRIGVKTRLEFKSFPLTPPRTLTTFNRLRQGHPTFPGHPVEP
jgi:hypothetical protein